MPGNSGATVHQPESASKALTRESGGRLGVATLDTANSRRYGWRADERVPMCSAFKLLAAALLQGNPAAFLARQPGLPALVAVAHALRRQSLALVQRALNLLPR